jgi:hypothetical protein
VTKAKLSTARANNAMATRVSLQTGVGAALRKVYAEPPLSLPAEMNALLSRLG